MLREAFDHRKLKRLKKRLGLRMWGARGICESLWHVTAREAPQGDIGKLTNDEIADAIDWAESADVLVKALIESELLDECRTVHRLLVHDWAEHADNGVRNKLKNRGLEFITLNGGPDPPPGHSPVGSGSGSGSGLEGGCGGKPPAVRVTAAQLDVIYRLYPRKVEPRKAKDAIRGAIKRLAKQGHDDPIRHITDRTLAFSKSPKGQSGRYCPYPATWFNGDRFDDDPADWESGDGVSSGGNRPEDTPGTAAYYAKQRKGKWV